MLEFVVGETGLVLDERFSGDVSDEMLRRWRRRSRALAMNWPVPLELDRLVLSCAATRALGADVAEKPWRAQFP